MLWTYLGDALWVAALTIMFAASRSAAPRIPARVRLFGAEVDKGLVLWALPVGAFLVSLGLAYEARTRDLEGDPALILFGIRAVLASTVAMAQLRVLAGALKP
jgi:hypothetical protein